MALQTSRDPAGYEPARHGGLTLGQPPHFRPVPASWPLAQPLALFLLAALVIGWPWLSGHVTIPWDAKAHFLPQIQFLAQSLARGESPFWAPFVFAGHPQIADPQAMIFSPPFLILALLNPAPTSWDVDVTLLAMVFLGGAVLMLWFRDQGWHWAGAIVAALAFSYGASMAWRIQHITQVLSLAYLPIAMLCLDRALVRRSLVYGAAAGLAAGLIVLDRDQVALLSIYLLAGLTAWRLLGTQRPLAEIRACLPALAGAALVGLAVVLLPVVLSVLLAAQSNRPAIDYIGAGRGSLHPALLLTFVVPEAFAPSGRMADYWGPASFPWNSGIILAQNMGQLYIGAIPLLLLVLAAARGLLWAREVRFFTAACAAMLLYALGWYTPVFRLFYEVLPGVDLYRRPADATFLVGALTAVLAGYAAHRLANDPPVFAKTPTVAAAAGTLLAALLVVLGLGFWLGRASGLPLPLATTVLSFAGAALALAAVHRHIGAKPVAVVALMAAITAADLAYNNGPNSATALPPATYDVLDPGTRNETIAFLKSNTVRNETRRDRIELAGLGFHWPNASLTHRLENTLGYNPLRFGLYCAATAAGDHVGLPEERRFSALLPSYRSRLADLLGLRFIATGVPIETIDRSLQAGDLPLVARTDDGFIYENPTAMDRVLFATDARSADFTRMLRDGRWPDADLRSTVLLENAPDVHASRRRGQVRIVSYHNTEVVLEADSPDGGWVVLNDLWHPWWFADVDGQRARMLRANVLFRAVAVTPGRHTIRFTFHPLTGAWRQITGRARHPVVPVQTVQGDFGRHMALADGGAPGRILFCTPQANPRTADER